MNPPQYFLKSRPAAFGMGVAVLLTLAGCAGREDGPPAGARFTHAEVYVTPPDLRPGVPVTDVYYYYPAWGVYYNTTRRQFAYLEGGVWVIGPVPPGVPIYRILTSPSVRMNFFDSPTNHHAETVLQYPNNWQPATTN